MQFAPTDIYELVKTATIIFAQVFGFWHVLNSRLSKMESSIAEIKTVLVTLDPRLIEIFKVNK